MARRLGLYELMLSTVAVTVLNVSACSDDDAPAGASGNAGTTGGSAGSAGTSGRGGSSGTSGRGGSGGTSGATGSGGTSGATGSGGSGASDAGDGSVGTGGTTDAGTDADDPDSGLEPILRTLSPLPAVPADTTNGKADNAAAAALGQKLFFDQNFSGPLKVASDLGAIDEAGKVSCASCHSGSNPLDDTRSQPDNVSLGADFHTRNAPGLVNASFYKWTNWGGRFAAQWELPLAVVENGVIMNGNRLKVAHRIFDVYRTEYEAVFGAMDAGLSDLNRFPANGKPKPAPTPAVPNPPNGPWEDVMNDADRLIVNTILANYSKAIAAYMRLLVSRNAPFDAWIAGNASAIDASAKRGATLFATKARCINCHSGPFFSDGEFHNLGVSQTGAHVPASDDGRFKDVPPLLGSAFNVEGAFSDDTNTDRLAGLTNPMPDSTKGQFRTPTLRGVSLTAPYMHSGQIATLEEVVEFYDRGGGTPVSGQLDSQLFPLHLTAEERTDLVNFLKTLNGDPVPAALLVDSTP